MALNPRRILELVVFKRIDGAKLQTVVVSERGVFGVVVVRSREFEEATERVDLILSYINNFENDAISDSNF